MSPGEYLQGQLERLFELDGMMALSSELLGVEPTELGGTDAKGTFARALVRHCETHDELAVLAEAIRLSANDQGIAEPLPATDEELAIGAEVRGLRVLEQFERGSLAALYLVEQPCEGGVQRAHLKVFRRELTRDRVTAFRLLSAARALRDVRDPGLSSLLDAGTLPDGRVFLLTEAVRGQTLAERVRRTGPLSFSELRPIARSLLRGLSTLHARGLLHGYLSPAHVVIVRPPQPSDPSERVPPHGVLEGLAISKLLEGDADAIPGVLRLLGDPATIAPEVARGQRPSPQSEIYALGCVFYYALTGSHVFEGEAPIDQVLAHVMEEPTAPSLRAPDAAIGAELDAVILQALAKQPEQRFADVRAFAAALEAVPRASIPPGPPREVSHVVDALRATPGDLALALELESLVEPEEGARVAVAVYRELAAEVTDEAVKKQLLFRAARLLRVEVGDEEGAADVYRELLAVDPADLAAHAALAELYRARGEHEALIGVLLDRLDVESDSPKRATILLEAAQHYEELEQRDNALVAYTQALVDAPEDPSTQRAIERLAGDGSKLQEVLATLHERLHGGELDAAGRQRLSVLVGRWSLDRLGRPEAARPYLDEALAIAPDDAEALEVLTRLHTQTGDHPALLAGLLRRAGLASSPAEKRALKAAAAAVAHLHLGDLALAESLYAEVFAEDPSHLEAARALEEIYADTGRRDKLLALLAQRLTELQGAARAEALCELAVLHEDETHARAIALYEEALRADPECRAAYAGLAAIYASQDDHAALRGVLERELGVASHPQQRIKLLERIGRICEEVLCEPAAAADCFERIVALAPNHDHANAALARLYRVLHRFDELARTYERHAKGVDDDERKVELMMLAARVWMADLAAPEQAALMCERVLAVVPTHPEALALSARIKAHTGDTFAALDALEVLADTERDPARRADFLVRAGQLLESESDLDAAAARYERALDVSSGHVEALDALARIHTLRGDLRGQAALLQRRAELAQVPAEQAALLASLGRMRKDELGDRGLALDAFRRAYELDPDNRDARIGLGQLALEESRFDEAVALLQPLLDHTIGVPDALALPLLKGLGAALRSMGELQQAERAYLSARAIDRDDLTLVERLAEIALAEERFESAAELLETLVAEPSEVELDDAGEATASRGYAEQPYLWQQLGHARFRMGDLAGAAAALVTAQELDPEEADTLVALAEVQERQGDVDGLAITLQRRLELPLADSARLALLTQAGDLAAQRGDQAHAAALYTEALELGPDDRNLLSKLMAMYSQERDWPRLLEVLVRMASVVDDPALSAKYLATAGGIAQTELHDLEAASEYYESALAHDPALEGAWRGLVAGLTQAGAWDKLAGTYRAQIERQRAADRGPDELAALWDELGAIYRDRLHRLEPAIEAYQAASALMPAQTERLAPLVELYDRLPSRFAESAITAHERLLAADPSRIDSYRALRKLYTQLQRPDEAWALCQALRSLGAAEPEEEAFFRRHRVQAPATARECITEELWRAHVLLEEQDQSVTQMLALVQPAAIHELAQAPEVFGIARDGGVTCATDDAVMARMLHYATGVLLVPLPPVFKRPHDPGGVSFLFTNPPALGLGQGALRSAPDQALAFIAGRQLSYFRPGHYLRQLLPTGSGLRAWLLGAIRLVRPRFPIPEGMGGQVERAQSALARTLHVPQQQALASLVEKLLREQPELDLKRWALAVDLAADRAGFILANSLDAAVAVIRASPQDSSYASERERLSALSRYAVSARYLALRKAIGVTIA